jgi:hypothetical protein
MVLGIFMCVFLVGSLWYIAGIGDALVYHERMQEGADAVAFSAATIEARGMNIIVLINMLMACILAIRVAINVVKYGLIIAAGIFGALSLIPFAGAVFGAAAGFAAEGAEAAQNVDNSTRTAIDDALIALHGTWTAVKYATPPAAFAGGLEIASKYSPIVVTVPPALIFGATIGTGGKGPSGGGNGGGAQIGLPVEDGSLTRLCEGAFKADQQLIQDSMPGVVGKIGGAAVGLLSDIVNGLGLSDAFCELGNSGPPDMSKLTSQASGAACAQQRKAPCDAATAAEAKLSADSASCMGYMPGDPVATPESACQSTVDGDNSDYQTKDGECHQFDNCESQANGDAKGTGGKATQGVSKAGTSGGSSGDKFPARTPASWHDGTPDAQILAVVFSDTTGSAFVGQSAKFEKIAAGFQSTPVTYDSPGNMGVISSVGPFDPTLNALAQAEFFYDCTGDWKTADSCDNDENAMWNFHWRARFRLVNPDASTVAGTYIKAVDLAFRAKMTIDAAKYGTKWAGEGISVSTAVEAVTAGEITIALDTESQLTIH